MASTTTLKLPEELKARIASAAQATGKSAHAFMVEALETQARLTEMRQSFINDAIASADEVDAGGALYAMEDVQAYILARTAGKAAKRPKPIVRTDIKPPVVKNKSSTAKRAAR